MRILIGLLVLFSGVIWADSPSSFAQAKKIVKQLFHNHPKTIYCGCSFEDKVVNLDSCGMEQAHLKKRAYRVEIEHFMAVEHFGQNFECWRKPLCQDKKGKLFKGRACCQKIDARFRHMEAELYNLGPENGLVNQGRSNYRFGVLSNQTNYYGCPIKIDKALRRAEPDDVAKGVVARSYLFMSEHYHLPLSKSQRQLFERWNKLHSPSQWERNWATQIAEIEGYQNKYIAEWTG